MLWVAVSTAAVAGQAPTRVDTPAALAQLVTKVEPIMPAEAERARIGGTVVADVTVDVRGRVTSVTILAGHEMLHAAAEAALRQWIFRPFLIEGQAHPARVVLDVDFPDPVRDEELRVREAFREALYACERQLEIDPVQAVDLCGAAVTASERLPADVLHERVVGQREMAVLVYLRSLVLAGRLQDAVVTGQQLIEARSGLGPGADRGRADHYVMLAMLQQRIGAYEEAEQAFSQAVALHEALFREATPETATAGEELRDVLRAHAALRRARGDTTGANALEARAAAIDVPPPPAERAAADYRRVVRRVGDITIVESHEARMSDDDIRQIQSALAPRIVWWLGVQQLSEPGRDPAPSVTACVTPDVVRPGFRRGRCPWLVRRAADAAGPARWELFDDRLGYVQIAADGAGASAQPPSHIMVRPNASMPADEVLIEIAATLRAKAVSTETARLASDVQPWPISQFDVASLDEIYVTLSREDGRGWQNIRLRLRNGAWDIVEMRGSQRSAAGAPPFDAPAGFLPVGDASRVEAAGRRFWAVAMVLALVAGVVGWRRARTGARFRPGGA